MSRLAIRVAVYAASSQVDADSAKKACDMLAQALGAEGCEVDVGLMRLDNLVLPAAAAGRDPSPPGDQAGASYSGAEFNMQAQADALVFVPQVNWGTFAEAEGAAMLPVESPFGRLMVRLRRDAHPHGGRRVPVLVLLLPAPAESRAELPRKVRALAATDAEWRTKIPSTRRRALKDRVLQLAPAEPDVGALLRAIPQLEPPEERYIKEYVLPELGARALVRARELHGEETLGESVRRLPVLLRDHLAAPLPAHLGRAKDLIAAINFVALHTRTRKEARALRAQECAKGADARATVREERHSVQRAFQAGPGVRLRVVDLCRPMVRLWTRRPTRTALARAARALLTPLCGRRVPDVSYSAIAARHPA